MENILVDQLGIDSLNSLSTFNLSTFIDFFMCFAFAFTLKLFYERNSISISGKHQISSIIPILSLVVFLVILVVKSSLALSLGLVGALSIVRFRTPIKEPEELVYLFLAIAIGLGFGAGQTLTTSTVITLILVIIYLFVNNKKILNSYEEFNLIISWKNKKISSEDILKVISNHTQTIKMTRYEDNPEISQLTLLLEKVDNNLLIIQESLKDLDKDIEILFFEAKNNW